MEICDPSLHVRIMPRFVWWRAAHNQIMQNGNHLKLTHIARDVHHDRLKSFFCYTRSAKPAVIGTGPCTHTSCPHKKKKGGGGKIQKKNAKLKALNSTSKTRIHSSWSSCKGLAYKIDVVADLVRLYHHFMSSSILLKKENSSILLCAFIQ